MMSEDSYIYYTKYIDLNKYVTRYTYTLNTLRTYNLLFDNEYLTYVSDLDKNTVKIEVYMHNDVKLSNIKKIINDIIQKVDMSESVETAYIEIFYELNGSHIASENYKFFLKCPCILLSYTYDVKDSQISFTNAYLCLKILVYDFDHYNNAPYTPMNFINLGKIDISCYDSDTTLGDIAKSIIKNDININCELYVDCINVRTRYNVKTNDDMQKLKLHKIRKLGVAPIQSTSGKILYDVEAVYNFRYTINIDRISKLWRILPKVKDFVFDDRLGIVIDFNDLKYVFKGNNPKLNKSSAYVTNIYKGFNYNCFNINVIELDDPTKIIVDNNLYPIHVDENKVILLSGIDSNQRVYSIKHGTGFTVVHNKDSEKYYIDNNIYRFLKIEDHLNNKQRLYGYKLINEISYKHSLNLLSDENGVVSVDKKENKIPENNYLIINISKYNKYISMTHPTAYDSNIPACLLNWAKLMEHNDKSLDIIVNYDRRAKTFINNVYKNVHYIMNNEEFVFGKHVKDNIYVFDLNSEHWVAPYSKFVIDLFNEIFLETGVGKFYYLVIYADTSNYISIDLLESEKFFNMNDLIDIIKNNIFINSLNSYGLFCAGYYRTDVAYGKYIQEKDVLALTSLKIVHNFINTIMSNNNDNELKHVYHNDYDKVIGIYNIIHNNNKDVCLFNLSQFIRFMSTLKSCLMHQL